MAGFLTAFRERMRSQSVLKGQVVSFTMQEFGATGAGVTFHERPQVEAGDVILGPGVLARIARHVVEMAEVRANLRRLGQHLKRGVLLYGPPGTGKTHTVRHLLSRSEGTTAILLSGGSLAFISEAARMARALQPSIVVLEDCDLIAEDRSFGHGPQPLLFEVLDAMDGLDDDADVAFVLTTNRVEALEHALAQRPGRVDLAVEIPRPNAEQREALIRLYARSLGLGAEAMAQAAERTAGTTASFARELVRRTVVAAAAAGREPGDADLLAAVDELMADGEALTRSLLGSDGDGGGPGGPSCRGCMARGRRRRPVPAAISPTPASCNWTRTNPRPLTRRPEAAGSSRQGAARRPGSGPADGADVENRTAAEPVSLEAARSTSALMPQSWLPAGSSKICRTFQTAGLLGDDQQRRAAGVRAGADVFVFVEVGIQGVGPTVGVPAGVGVEGAQGFYSVVGEELHAAEHLVAHHDAEGAEVVGEPRRPADGGARRRSAAPRRRSSSPTRPAGWSPPGGPVRPARR